MTAPLEIDTLIEELQRAKAEGATKVLLQINGMSDGRMVCWQASPEFSMHEPNIVDCYVVGGDRIRWEDWATVEGRRS